MMTLTLQDIADRAGVSRMSVSRVLRNAPGVSRALRERVLRVVQETGYRPNPLIAALMSTLRHTRARRSGAPGQGGTVRSIAFLTSGTSESAWRRDEVQAEMFHGAEAHGRELGWLVTPVWLRQEGLTGPGLHRMLRARGVEGLIVGTLPGPWRARRFEWDHYAVAALGYTLRRPAFHRIASHHFQSVRLALETLRRRGYRRIGLAMTARENRRFASLPVSAYLGFEHGERQSQRLEPYLPAERGHRDRFRDWLRRERPDALLLGRSLPSAPAWGGLRIPEELGLVVLGSSPEGYCCVNRDYPNLGRCAVDLVIAQLHRNERGIPERPQTVLLDTLWVEGSTAPRHAVHRT